MSVQVENAVVIRLNDDELGFGAGARRTDAQSQSQDQSIALLARCISRSNTLLLA